jgi:hypothetical protein
MKRNPPANRRTAPQARVQPSAEHAELALREARVLMAPVALWLLRHGVSFPAFAEVLKAVFVDAARDELERSGTTTTQSALSLLSGVHRKDVRDLGASPDPTRAPGRPTLSSQVFTRWLTDARYRGVDGSPRALPRAGTKRSFEGLCRELSNDVHPRAVLDELLRLGLVELDGERVVARAHSFVPSARLDEMTALFSANAADHIAAAVSNLTLKGPPLLEQSVYADGLTPESIEVLHAAARQAWTRAFDAVVAEARDCVDRDMHSDGRMRMRFGTYFFSEAVPEPGEAPAPAPVAPRSRRSPARPAEPVSPVRRRTRPKSRP